MPAVDEDVIHDGSVGIAHHRIPALPDLHVADPIGQQPIQVRTGFLAGDDAFAHVGNVKQAGGFSHRLMLGENPPLKVEGHLPPAEINKFGVFAIVLKKRSPVHLSLLPEHDHLDFDQSTEGEVWNFHR